MPNPITVTLVDSESRTPLTAERGEILLNVLRRSTRVPVSPCGGRGTCRKCGVQVEGQGLVLSCQLRLEQDIDVIVPAPDRHQRILDSATVNLKEVPLDSGISHSVNGNEVSFKGAHRCVAAGERLLGMAVDIGTTTVVVYLEDLATHALIDVTSFVNPQTRYGHDVIARIHYAIENADGLERQRRAIVDGLNHAIAELCDRNDVPPESVYTMTIAANTVMLHLFAGVDPAPIAYAPFTPAFVEARILSAAAAGIAINPSAAVRLLASVSGYVGADITAGIASTPMLDENEWSLFLDIGTNGEMAVGNRHVLYCCATAAGPAFEGAKISCGCGGVQGAIAHCRDGACTTIGGEKAVGICGSGLLDVVAHLIDKGSIDMAGFMEKDFVIVPMAQAGVDHDIALSPADVREVQLAKAAIHAGISVMLSAASLSFDDVSRVYMAGAFGNYMAVDSAVRVGLLPKELGAKVIHVGNAAGSGARLALRSIAFEEHVAAVARKAQYIELSMRQDFNDAYVNAMMFD